MALFKFLLWGSVLKRAGKVFIVLLLERPLATFKIVRHCCALG